MSDLLTAAAQALNAPESIVKRSAEARAKAGGVSVDEVLAAWSGGGPVVASPAPVAPTKIAEPKAPSEPVTEEATTPAAAMAEAPAPVMAAVAVVAAEEQLEMVPPAPLRARIKTAARVGAVSGAALGLLAAVLASPWLLPGATVVGEEGSFSPAVEVNTNLFMLASVLLSMVFGVIVASLARTVPGWLHSGMVLSGSARTGGFVGLGLGLALGAIGGGVVTAAFGAPIEGVGGRVVIPLLSALTLGLLGGAALGWLTAVMIQVIGVPVGVAHAADGEVSQVRSRLGSAISVPLAGIVTLAVLVLPFAYTLIKSNHLASGGASVIAILAALSILAVAGLSASRPGMRITRGEFLLALAGIGVVVTIIVAVLLARAESHPEESAAAPTQPTLLA